MEPFIVNPSNYVKEATFARATTYVKEFLALNGMQEPSSITSEKFPLKSKDYGLYVYGTTAVSVNLQHTRLPVKKPGFAWSYTGFKADLTAPGVLAHEVGHHVHNLMEMKHGQEKINELLVGVNERELKVSGYEPNAAETFAEAMRLFIMNPSLLREGRPVRWAMFTEILGIIPPHDAPWQVILQNAHPRMITAAQGWITKQK
jgi:hypothetical protein